MSGAGPIVRRKGVMGGVPCIAGTRVPSRAIWTLFHRGLSMEAIVVLYGLPEVDLLAVEEAVRFEMRRRKR